MDAFLALADPIRRQIIGMLATSERSVGEIGTAFAITAPAVSQHLKALREAGLVKVRVEGQRRLYRLDPDRFQEMQAWLAAPAAPRRLAMPIATLIDATDLEAWADRRDAQSLLPMLVRRLILATTDRITRIGFRAGEGVQLSGWDGTVAAEAGNAFVPTGISAWELGTNQNVQRKASEEYRKRTDNPDGIDPAQATYVFVTPRRWPGKAAWVAARQAEEVWGEVRVYDADDLETWLECARGVHVWLSMLLGAHPEDAVDLESVWADWSQATDPAITANFLLAGRSDLAKTVQAWLVDSSTSTLALQAESRDEALAVFAASVLQLPEEQRLRLLGRIIVVDTVAAWIALALSDEPLLLVMRFKDDQAIGRARRKGHRVLIPLGSEDTGDSAQVAPRVSRREAEEALRAAGVSVNDAAELVALARRSITSFRRRLALRPELQQPQWAQAAEGRSLVPALLVGAWNDQSAADRAVLSSLARREYEEFSDGLVRWANGADPPLRRVGDLWQLVSKEDAWVQLARYVRREDMDRFQEVVLRVLGTPDPRFDLPAEDRWLASVRGRVRQHSAALCHGIAETLAVMGSRGENMRITGNATLRDVATYIVRELLARANRDWRIWASIARYLPLLAEAAPDALLGAVEVGLAGDNPVVMELFVEEPSPLFGSSEHTGLLWALETLAWSRDCLGRATLILAQLARRDPGGKLANRPEATLRGIFLPWLPQTAATVEERLRVLDLLRQREPNVGWTLMRQLLPEFHSFGHPTAKPQWREWAPDTNAVTRRELFTVTKEVLQRMLDDVGLSGTRWEDLIGALASLPPEQYQAVVHRLGALDPLQLQPMDQAVVWNALRKLLSRHRSFPDADWSLPTERLVPLAEVFESLTPLEAVARYGWLFSDRPELAEGHEQDWKEKEEAVAAARLAAVQAVHAETGLPGVLALLEHVERPFWLGATLGSSALVDADEDAILKQNLAADVATYAEFARGFVAERHRSRGFGWAEAKMNDAARIWSARQRGEFLACLPNERATWDLMERTDPDTKHEYWRAMRPWGLAPADAERVVRNLVKHGRPYTAVDVLSMGVRRKGDIPQALIAEALEQAIQADPKTDMPMQLFSFNVGQLLNELKPGDEVDANRIAKLEWAYLPLLRFDRSPKFLHQELGRNPQFFSEIIALVFRAEGEEPHEVSKEQEAQARHGYDLLESWHTVPGTSDTGNIDVDELNGWVSRARELMQANGRGKIGDQMIGKVLSGSPPGTDGVWPAEPVRDIIENVASDDLEKGFEIGRYNSRGVITKNPAEGGEQERQLAKRYEKYAEAIRNRWPRTAAMLRRVADTYRAQARREDDQSELMGQLDA
jgi:DNA-binding transcriptional ArsR family regulator